MDSRFCRSLYVGITMTIRPADGSADGADGAADGFGSVTTPAYRCVGEQAVLSHGG